MGVGAHSWFSRGIGAVNRDAGQIITQDTSDPPDLTVTLIM
jgi:hypothetical protein